MLLSILLSDRARFGCLPARTTRARSADRDSVRYRGPSDDLSDRIWLVGDVAIQRPLPSIFAHSAPFLHKPAKKLRIFTGWPLGIVLKRAHHGSFHAEPLLQPFLPFVRLGPNNAVYGV